MARRKPFRMGKPYLVFTRREMPLWGKYVHPLLRKRGWWLFGWARSKFGTHDKVFDLGMKHCPFLIVHRGYKKGGRWVITCRLLPPGSSVPRPFQCVAVPYWVASVGHAFKEKGIIQAAADEERRLGLLAELALTSRKERRRKNAQEALNQGGGPQ